MIEEEEPVQSYALSEIAGKSLAKLLSGELGSVVPPIFKNKEDAA